MKQIVKYVISTLASDPTIQTYVGTRVSPQGVDISPEVLPCITVFQLDEQSKTVPFREREGLIQIDIWGNISQLQIENISERVLDLLNFAQYQSGYSTSLLRWGREESSIDLFETDRRIWHRAIRWRWWAKP